MCLLFRGSTVLYVHPFQYPQRVLVMFTSATEREHRWTHCRRRTKNLTHAKSKTLSAPSYLTSLVSTCNIFIAWLQAMLHALYLSHMHDAQERVVVRYIPARSYPCRCVHLEPGYKSLITPPLQDMAGIYAPYHLRGCYIYIYEWNLQ